METQALFLDAARRVSSSREHFDKADNLLPSLVKRVARIFVINQGKPETS